ncbi:unnamed protein product, partial [Onchocerca flexuosa]|uniref:AGC-kinase C-terminal domain-containing protein n=1 Tax=Onchocerca flexuosa TaxID=387005 RepID=A0A183I729_9BILA
FKKSYAQDAISFPGIGELHAKYGGAFERNWPEMNSKISANEEEMPKVDLMHRASSPSFPKQMERFREFLEHQHDLMRDLKMKPARAPLPRAPTISGI